MPRRFERHARSSWEWGTEPGRSDQVAAAVADQHPEPVAAKKAAAKKDTRQWCRGKEGREHQPAIVFAPIVIRSVPVRRREWRPSWMDDYAGLEWACWHREECSACGRILRDHCGLPAGECPDYPGDEGQKALAEVERADIAARNAVRPPRRRKVISGPQHYRRKKAS